MQIKDVLTYLTENNCDYIKQNLQYIEIKINCISSMNFNSNNLNTIRKATTRHNLMSKYFERIIE